MRNLALPFLAALALLGCSKTRPVVWEYQQVDWDNNFSSVQLTIDTDTTASQQDYYKSSTDLINALGAHHWELVSVVAGPGGESFYLKRPRGSVHETYLFDPHYKATAPGAK